MSAPFPNSLHGLTNDPIQNLLRKMLGWMRWFTQDTVNLTDIKTSIDAISGGGVATAITTGANTTVATAGTRQQLPSIVATRGVMVSGLPSNTSTVYVGDSSVTNAAGSKRGIPITAYGGTGLLAISNANLLYIDADVSGEGVSITVI